MRVITGKNMKTSNGFVLLTCMAKIFKKVKTQIILTQCHHHPNYDLESKMFGFLLFQYFSSFLNISKLYGQLLAFLDQFLPKNDKI